jgi:outer membrane lipoprotein-sorting protein
MRKDWFAIPALGLTLFVSGCSLFPTTRKLPVPKAPSITQTVSPEELVGQLNKRWADLNNLTVKVEIQATLLKSKEGVITDYPSCTGYIVMAKPSSLRVAGTYFGVSVFDMASDGKTFTLVVPKRNKAIEGPNSVTRKSDNPLENLRPGFFFDAMVVRGLDSDDYYSMTADTETVEDAAKKHLFTEPEYVLSVTRHALPGSRIDTPIRVVTFHRDDLLPYGQDLYDKNGNLESQVTYSLYQDFGGRKYPTKVFIKRPLEGIQLYLTVDWVHMNVDLPADEFHVQIPAGIQVQHLE